MIVLFGLVLGIPTAIVAGEFCTLLLCRLPSVGDVQSQRKQRSPKWGAAAYTSSSVVNKFYVLFFFFLVEAFLPTNCGRL
jgi:hypothetical protein